MRKIHFLFFIIVLLAACQNKVQQNAERTAPEDVTKSQDSIEVSVSDDHTIDSDDAIRWLKEVVESHFNDFGYEMEDICTPKYYAYKMDAVQVGYDDGLSEEQFSKKWSADFDTKYAGLGTGFLISGQDFGKIKVTECKVKSDQNLGYLILKVIITDTEFKQSYHRDIKIVAAGKAYLIDDVVEYD